MTNIAVYLEHALDGEAFKTEVAPEGMRNDVLNSAAYRMGRLIDAGMDQAEAEERLTHAAEEAGLGPEEIAGTIASGMAAGMEEPRVLQAPGSTDDAIPQDEESISNRKKRRIVLTSASTIKPERVHWLYQDRIGLGALSLVAGREGTGKSTLCYTWIAKITRGTLPGELFGTPKSVLVVATEDNWPTTIIPRLIAAGANLDRVHRVEVYDEQASYNSLSLPKDIDGIEIAAKEVDAVMVFLDPLMSRLDGSIDSHKDAEVRQALEPLAALSMRANIAVVGIIHHNKSRSEDPLQLVMGSKAFTAVPRSISTVIEDPNDPENERKLFATPKNNNGRTNLPVLAFTIESCAVETESDGTNWTGRIVDQGVIGGTFRAAMSKAPDKDPTATDEAADWLADYIADSGGSASSRDIKDAARKEGHSTYALKMASGRLGIIVSQSGFPRHTEWELPC